MCDLFGKLVMANKLIINVVTRSQPYSNSVPI